MKAKFQMFAMLLMLSVMTFSANAATKDMNRDQAQQVRVMEIKQRVEDIRSMDMSKLSATDKKEMKHELKDMKKELRQMEPYIYISAGALILIIILLILLL